MRSRIQQVFAATIVIALVLFLTGCKPTLLVSLASQQEKVPGPRFVVQDPARPGQRPLYDTIKLAEAGGELYWHLRAEPFGNSSSVATFAYAEPLKGFDAVVAPKPLEINHEYTLFVVGQAYGTVQFRVDAAGQIHVLND
jgi:hypothetical protein